MTNIVRNYGLDLEVYEPSTPVAWTKRQIRDQSLQNSRFIRRIYFNSYPYRFPDLKTGLQLARTVLLQTADIFDATLVDFKWALYEGACPADLRGSYEDTSHEQIPLVPKGFSLVANVESIHDKTSLPAIPLLSLPPEVLRSTYTERMRSRADYSGLFIPDIQAADFVHSQARGLYMVDIDAFLGGDGKST